MAYVTVALGLDCTVLCDQVDQVKRLYDALAGRHGAAFRDLQDRLERAASGGMTPEIHDLGDGEFTASIPVLAQLLREGRALGVI